MNLGKLAKKAKQVVDKQGDKIAAGVDKATNVVDQKTKGKYTDKLNKIDAAAQKLDKTKPATAAGEAEAEAQPEAQPEGGTPAS
jgi:hypothetical protein